MNTNVSTTPIDPVLLLRRELERRCQDNPRYSLRAFARALGISVTVLSLVLNRKRQLSKKAAIKALGALALSPQESASLHAWSKKRPSVLAPDPALASHPREADAHLLSLDSFSFIADWYHYAILSLLEIPGARFESKWISRRLGITEGEVSAAMDRLVRMEMLEQRDGRWRQRTGPLRIASDSPTAATRRFQKQLLTKAIHSLENDPTETRDFSSMTLAMDPELVPYAREEIRKFRRRLAEELEAKGNVNRVYELTVQIFPVSGSVSLDKKRKEKSV